MNGTRVGELPTDQAENQERTGPDRWAAGPRVRENFVFAPTGRWAACRQRGPDGRSRLELWHDYGEHWRSEAVPLPLEATDRLLPLGDGRLLVLNRAGDAGALLAVEHAEQPGKSAIRWLCEAPYPARLLPAAPLDPASLAVVSSYDGWSRTAFWRVRDSGDLEEFPAKVAGRCGGGLWLDTTGRTLTVNRALSGQQAQAIDVHLTEGDVQPCPGVGDDRVLLSSPTSDLLVVRSGSEQENRIAFVSRERPGQRCFPDGITAADQAVPLAIDPSGRYVLIHVRYGVMSGISIYRADGHHQQRLGLPAGSLRGQASWVSKDILLPWSTPTVPHTVLRLRHSVQPKSPVALRDARGAHVVRLQGATGPIEGIVYGDVDWPLSPRLAIVLPPGPTATWRLEYEPLFQELAQRGMTVLALNPRGGTRPSAPGSTEITGAWAGPDLADVRMVLRRLSELRADLVPPAILGSGYGAFVALLASCAEGQSVSACVALAPFLSCWWLYEQGGPAVRQTIERLDGLRAVEDDLGERDVLRLADRIAAPVLIVHGSDDEVIPVQQSRVLYRRLTDPDRSLRAGVQYLEIEDGGHDLLNGRRAEQVYAALGPFLSLSMAPAAVARRPVRSPEPVDTPS